MKFRLLIVWVLVLLCFSGCKKQAPQETVYTPPTLPSFDDSITPQSHLESAMEGLEGKTLTASFGSGLGPLELTTTQNMDELRTLVPNENLIARFSSMGMMISPSDKGSFQYQLLKLTPAQLCGLLCDRDLTEEEQQALSAYPDAVGSMTIGVDQDGVFQYLTGELTLGEDVWLLEIRITQYS